MKIEPTALPDVIVLVPEIYADPRGFLMESYNRRQLAAEAGIDLEFVQDNHSRSVRGTLRGLHYQLEQVQGKLVRVVRGRIFDVAVDLRRSSPAFGRWAGVELGEDDRRMMWLPPGFAHGFLVLSDSADVLYKTTGYYAPAHERSVRWDDPAIGIAWPLDGAPLLSRRDLNASLLRDADLFD